MRLLRVIPALLLLAALPWPAAAQARAEACRPDAPLASIPELPEASGIAVSRTVPGRLWAHNDSGEPVVFALDERGSVTGRVRLSGVAVVDWEALAVGPCPGGSCVFVADIGDNDAERKRITIYRFEEPPASAAAVAVKDVFHATYPDGPQDAEVFMVAPDGGLFIVTKGRTGVVALYRFPQQLRANETHRLERVGQPRASTKPAARERITDGAIAADGRLVVLRTGDWRATRTINLEHVGEAQGEGVALGSGNTVYLAGEGGSKSRPGTFARLACAVDD